MFSLIVLQYTAWSPSVDGRAAASRRSAIGIGAALFAPLPALAKSKEKARNEAIQRETAKEARQAMKEYKYAPRPELEYGKKPDGTMGYIYKEGTVKAGSQGELSGYFNEKGAELKAGYMAEKAKGTGASSEQAKQIAAAKEAELKAAAKARKTRVLTDDEKRIQEYASKNKDMVDEQGRRMF